MAVTDFPFFYRYCLTKYVWRFLYGDHIILVKYTLTLFLLYVYVCVSVYIFMYVCAHSCEFPGKTEKETGVPEAE